MAATPINDDGLAVTYQLDDGSTVRVAKDAAARLGAPMPSPMGGGTSAPAQLSQTSPVPTEIAGPAIGVRAEAPPVNGVPADLAPPPIPSTLPSFAGPAPAPAAPPPDVPVQAPVQPLYGKDLAKRERAYAQAQAAQLAEPFEPAPKNKPAPPPVPAPPRGKYFGDVVAAGEEAQALQEQAIGDRMIAEEAATRRIADTLTARNDELNAIREKQLADQQRSMSEIERRAKTVDAAIADYNKTAIDPNRLSKSLSTGQKAAQIFFQAMTGLGMALKGQGERNPAIDMWLAQVDRDIRLQMDARDQKRDQIGQQKDALAMVKDLAQTKEGTYALAMAAETDRAAKTLEQIAAQTKNETVRANALESMGLLRQQSAAFKGTWAQAEFSADMQARGLQEQIAARKAQNALGWAGQKLARDRFEQDKVEFAWTKENQKKTIEQKAQELALAGNAKLAEDVRKFGVGAPTTVVKNAAGEVVRDEQGNPVTRSGTLLNKDGTPFLARNEQQAEKIGNKISVAGEIVDIIDEVSAIRERSGGETSWGNSNDFQRIKVLQERLTVLAKSGTEGMSSDADMARLTATLGASDLSSFRDRAAGLKEARERTQTFLNRELQTTYGYKGDPIQFDNVHANVVSPAEGAYKAVVSGQTQDQLTADATPGVLRRGAEYITGGGLLYESSSEKAAKAAAGETTSPYGLDPKAQAGVDVLTRRMQSRDATEAKAAAEKLIGAARENPAAAVAIASSVRDQAPEIYSAIKGQLPKAAVAEADRVQAERAAVPLPGGGSVVDTFTAGDVARIALQPNAEGRRALQEVFAATKSPDMATRRRAQEVINEIRAQQGGR